MVTEKQQITTISPKRAKIFDEIQSWLNWFVINDSVTESEFFTDLTVQIGRVGKVLFESNQSTTWKDYRLEVNMLAAVALGMLDYYFDDIHWNRDASIGRVYKLAWRNIVSDACYRQDENRKQAGLDQRLWFIVMAVGVGEIIEAYRGKFGKLMRARRALVNLAASCVLAVEALGNED